MARQYDNTNTLMLFRNDRKESPKHPDWKGTYTDSQNVEYWADAWLNSSVNGDYIKCKIGKRKEPRPDYQSAPPQRDMYEHDRAQSYEPPPEPYPQTSARDDQLVYAMPPGASEAVRIPMGSARSMGWPIVPGPQR